MYGVGESKQSFQEKNITFIASIAIRRHILDTVSALRQRDYLSLKIRTVIIIIIR